MFEFPHRYAVRITPPAVEPLSLSEVKTFLRIDGSDEDSILATLISTARIIAEELTGKALITQSWKLAYDHTLPPCVMLPNRPVQSITSVVSVSDIEASTTISSGTYYLNASRDTLMFESIPSGRRIEISYVSGYGNAATDVPADIRQAMLVHVATLYEHRDSQTPPPVAQWMYAQHREVHL